MSFALLSRKVLATCGKNATVASRPAKYPIGSVHVTISRSMPLRIQVACGLHAEIVVINLQSRSSADKDVARGLHADAQPHSVKLLVVPLDLGAARPKRRTL